MFELFENNSLFYKVYWKDFLNANEVKKGTIDLVITSPNYNIGKEYEDNLTFQEYLEFSKEWITIIKDLLKPNGTFWFNIGFFKQSKGAQYIPWAYYIYHIINEIGGLHLIQEVIWHYGAGVNCKNKFSPRNEKWLFYVKNLKKYTFNLDEIRVPHKYPHQYKNGNLKVNPLGKNPGDVWAIPKVTSGENRASPERTSHPAQFPEAIVERLMKVSSNPSDIVLDPFLGSGTTMKVARDLGRSCIGYEKKKEYLEDIVKDRVFHKYSYQLTLI